VADDINDLLCVHDCFGCLAPQAAQLNKIIRRELAIMYCAYDALGTLRESCPSIKPPKLGKLDATGVQIAKWLCI
jgi:hypothetical protein